MTSPEPSLATAGPWHAILAEPDRAALEAVLPAFMQPRRWFGSKARPLRSAAVVDVLPLADRARLAIVQVNFWHGPPDLYALPLAFAAGDEAAALRRERSQAVVAALASADGEGVLYDAVWNPAICAALLAMLTAPQRVDGQRGALESVATCALSRLYDGQEALPPHLLGVEQSNTSIRFGDRLILKLYRRLEEGVNPDVEIGRYLTEQRQFPNVPAVAAVLYYHPPRGDYPSLRRDDFSRPATEEEATALALLQAFVPNRGDAWHYTLDCLHDTFDRLLAAPEQLANPPVLTDDHLLDLAEQPIPSAAAWALGSYLSSARLLGRRTAELHLALAAATDDPAFAPEPFTADFQAALRQEMEGLTAQVLALLQARLPYLPPAAQPRAEALLARQAEIGRRLAHLVDRPMGGLRIRIHGDYHLGQVLVTNGDFMIIDFEGEPARPLAERRQRRPALQDVAGMLRSFHYAAYAALFHRLAKNSLPPQVAANLETWARYWRRWASAAYLRSYLDTAAGAAFLPASAMEQLNLLDALLLGKAIYELGYELNNRPSWVGIPLQGILHILQAS